MGPMQPLRHAKIMWTWLESRGLYAEGIRIVLAYGDKPREKRYWKARERQDTPANRLRLEQAVRAILNGPRYWRAKEKVQSAALPEPLPDQEPRLILPAADPADTRDPRQAIEGLTQQIRQLATERALLTNRLADPGEDETLIEANCAILDQMAPLVMRIRELEERRDKLAKEGLPDPDEDLALVVSTMRGHHYTRGMLKEMALPDLQDLATRIASNITRISRRAEAAGTKPALRQDYEKRIIAMRHEVVAIRNIIERKRMDLL